MENKRSKLANDINYLKSEVNNKNYFLIQPIVNVMESPNNASSIKTSLKKGTKFKIINVVKDHNGEIWYEIQQASVNLGFIISLTNITSKRTAFVIGGAIGYSFICWFIIEILAITNTSNSPHGALGLNIPECLYTLFFGFLMALIASKKGFEPLAWILTGGVIGLIIIVLLPSANEQGIDIITRKNRSKTGNVTGLITSCIFVAIVEIIAILK